MPDIKNTKRELYMIAGGSRLGANIMDNDNWNVFCTLRNICSFLFNY